MPKAYLSEISDVAIKAVRTRVRDYLSVNSLVLSRGKSRLGQQSRVESVSREALATIVSYAEGACADLLIEAFPQVTVDEVFSWPKKEKAWQVHASVNLHVDVPTYAQLLGFVQARNAIMHNDGQLTQKQLEWNAKEDGALTKAIRDVGIEQYGPLLRISTENVLDCSEVCVRFIREIDLLI
ncbi:hypothetical protein ACFYOT_01830 [Saccharothrix saharensis]|uniref:hypothetical protein n=1 Tax=Saccharothrix saharensis TaxID=571190 RepID=UPI0036CF7FF6